MKSRDKATVAVQTDPEMLIKEKKKAALSSELGAYETVKARLWSWLEPLLVRKSSKSFGLCRWL